jgi:hypothetical protein
MLGYKEIILNQLNKDHPEPEGETLGQQLRYVLKDLTKDGKELNPNLLAYILVYLLLVKKEDITSEKFYAYIYAYIKAAAKEDMKKKRGQKMEAYEAQMKAMLEDFKWKAKGATVSLLDKSIERILEGKPVETNALLSIIADSDDHLESIMAEHKKELRQKLQRTSIDWDTESDGYFSQASKVAEQLKRASWYLERAIKKKHLKSIETYAFEMGMLYQQLKDQKFTVPVTDSKFLYHTL